MGAGLLASLKRLAASAMMLLSHTYEITPAYIFDFPFFKKCKISTLYYVTRDSNVNKLAKNPYICEKSYWIEGLNDGIFVVATSDIFEGKRFSYLQTLGQAK